MLTLSAWLTEVWDAVSFTGSWAATASTTLRG